MTVKSYKGKTRVDVRQYQNFGEKIYPTKTGVHLSRAQFENLRSFLDEIIRDIQEYRDNKVEAFKYNIGNFLYVSASDGYPVVHIRFYFQNELMPLPLPTKSGIALRFDEWNKLVSVIEEIKKKLNI